MIAVAVENQGPGKEVPPGAFLDTGIGFLSKVVNHCEKEFLSSKDCVLKDQCCLNSHYQNFTQVITGSHHDTLDNS